MVELREFDSADAGLLISWIGGPEELLTWSGPAFRWPLDPGQLGAYAAESVARRRIWTAVDARSGAAVGHASLKLETDRPSGRLGRVLVAPGARGRGVGAAMLTQVLAHAFDELGLARVELGVFTHNGSAIRLYERLGFVCDRVLHDVERVNGRPWCAMQMSVHRPVPPRSSIAHALRAVRCIAHSGTRSCGSIVTPSSSSDSRQAAASTDSPDSTCPAAPEAQWPSMYPVPRRSWSSTCSPRSVRRRSMT